jgi:hypothetical protein
VQETPGQAVDQSHSENPRDNREETKAEFTRTCDVEPGTKEEIVERSVLPGCHKELQEVSQWLRRESDGIHLISPQALELQSSHTQCKGQADYPSQQPPPNPFLHGSIRP